MLGRHLLVDMHFCDPARLDDLKVVAGSLEAAVRACGATRIGELTHEFDPQGVTVIVGIAESHISIHTWPEKKEAVVDIFTCGEKMNPEAAVLTIVAFLGCQWCKLVEIERGGPNGPCVVRQSEWDQTKIAELGSLV